MENTLRILFIGNSHTFFNYMPHLVAEQARREGFDCQVTMIAHGGWFLDQHVVEQEVKFNIRFGNYDYVVLQEHAHPFGPELRFFLAVRQLDQRIRDAGSRTVIYMPWAPRGEEYKQAAMTRAHEQIAEEVGALLAPVGSRWWDYQRSHPAVEMYYKDGGHASPEGSAFAAKVLWETIRDDIDTERKGK